jgi:nucleolar MIF4G domain-containing protein 1
MFLFLCFLFRFHVVGASLILSFLSLALENPTEVSLSWTLDAIRSAGPQLRAQDPEGLLALLKPLLSMAPQQKSVRFKYMLEQLTALKNNTLRSNATALEDLLQSMIKLVRNHFKLRGGLPFEPFRVTIQEIRAADSVGRWWVVGAAWAGRDSAPQAQKSVDVMTGASAELLAMAKKLSINTEVRKRIFMALMTADDFLDAVDRLAKLNLRGAQEREIIRMIVYLCSQVCL